MSEVFFGLKLIGAFLLFVGCCCFLWILIDFLFLMTRRINEIISNSFDKASEPVKGIWMTYPCESDKRYYCSECQCLNWERSRYCPHCGRRMNKE